jgi:hypothetical protein
MMMMSASLQPSLAAWWMILSLSKLATAKEREDFIERNLERVSRVIETKFGLGQFDSGGHDGRERLIRLETAYLRGLNLQ